MTFDQAARAYEIASRSTKAGYDRQARLHGHYLLLQLGQLLWYALAAVAGLYHFTHGSLGVWNPARVRHA